MRDNNTMPTGANSNMPNFMEYGIGFFKNSATDGCNNNSIKNCVITLNRINCAAGPSIGTNAWNGATGIIFWPNARTSITTTITPTSTAGTSSNNSITLNTIQQVNQGIGFYGYAATSVATFGDNNNTIGGAANTNNGNTIKNFGGATTNYFVASQSGVASGYVFTTAAGNIYRTSTSANFNTVVPTGTTTGTAITTSGPTMYFLYATSPSNGIIVNNQWGVNINNNTVTSNDGTAGTNIQIANTVRGILLGAAQGASSTTSYNTINIQTAAVGSSINGIENQSGSTAASNSVDITNNNLSLKTTLGLGTAGTFTVAQTTTVYPLFNNGGTPTTINMSSNTISSVVLANTSGNLFMIYNTGAATNVTMNSNTINGGFTWGSSATSGIFALLYNSGAWTGTLNMNSNSFQNLTGINSTGTIYMIYNSVATAGAANYQNNTFNTIGRLSSNTTGGTYGYYNISTPSGTHTYSGNTVSNISHSTSSSGLLYGFYNLTSASSTWNIYNNNVNNITNGTGTCYGMYIGYGTVSVYNNNVNNISTAGLTYGMIFSTGIPSGNVYSNNINTISSTGTSSTVYGMACSHQSTGTAINYYKNKIYNIQANGTSGIAYGMWTTTGATINLYNNLIGDIKAPNSSLTAPAPSVAGLYINAGTTINASFNSIYLNATASSGNFGSAAVYMTATPTSITLRNNIFVNNSSASGTGRTVAVQRSAAALTNFSSSSNNNLYYVPVTSSGAGCVYFYDGTNSDATISNYKTRVSPRESSSIKENPTFVSTTGSNTNFLNISTTIGTQAESGGITVSGITDDYAGNTRNASTPDIGAYEFNGIAADLSGPSFTNNTISNTASLSNLTVTANITDPSSVDPSPGVAPRLYYKRSSDPNIFNTNDNTTAGWKYVETSSSSSPYSFTIDYSLLNNSTVSVNDVFNYFFVAQDASGAVNVSASPAIFATNPVSVDLGNDANYGTGVTWSNLSGWGSYTILGSVSGVLTVCPTGCNYSSLTNSGGAFADINSKVVTGNITLRIDASLTSETGTIALNEFASPFTLTIKPNTGTTPTISGTVGGALIKLNGADRVTIDGSNTTNGTSRDLTINNLSTAASAVINVASLGSAGNGANNVTIKNCYIRGGSGTTAGIFGIVSSASSSLTTAADDNDNLTIENNRIDDVYRAITCLQSNTSLAADNLIIRNNDIGSTVAADYVTFKGIEITYANAPLVEGNNIFNIITSASISNAAIELNAGVNGGSIIRNKISGIYSTSTTGYGAYGINFTSATSTTNVTIANNMIWDMKTSNYSLTSTTFNAFGIRIVGGTNLKIYNNTINFGGSVTGGTGTGMSANICVTTSTNTSGLDIRNNILNNSQDFSTSGSACYNIYLASGVTLATCNYNNYSGRTGTNTTYNVGYGGSTAAVISTFANWQTFTGQDANSLTLTPVFVSATDMHIKSSGVNIGLYKKGQTIAGITKDIDGDTRQSPPDLGADEFTLPTQPDIALASLVNPYSTSCHSSAETVTVAIANYSAATHDFSTNPATITVNVSGTTTATLTTTVNSGTLAPGATLQVNVGSLNTSTTGTYSFSSSVSITNDNDATNNSNTTSFNLTYVALNATISAAQSQLCLSGTTTVSVTATGGTTPYTYSWTPNLGSSASINTGTISSTTSYSVTVTDACNSTITKSQTVTVNNPVLNSVSPATRCGFGTVSLSASVSAGATTNWYTTNSGGVPVSTSNPFITPNLSSTTTYYASAAIGTTVASVGLSDRVGTTQNTGYSDVGLMFDAYSAFTIQSVNIYPVGSGAATVTISLKASDGTTLASTTANVTATAAPGIKTLVPLNFAVPSAGTNYRLTVTAASGLTGLTRESSTGYTYPYTLAGVCSITSAYTSGASSSYYYYLYDWLVTVGCESARTAVTATVTTPPSITPAITGRSTICNGSNSTMTVSSTNSGYSYYWSTSVGGAAISNGNRASVTVSPNTTTKYYVNANDNTSGCSLVDSLTIQVQPSPTSITLATPQLCVSGSNTLTVNYSGTMDLTNVIWQSSSTGSGYTDIAGTTTDVYSTPTLTSTTYYRFKVKDAAGNTCSNSNATVIVNTPAVISAPSVTRCGAGTVNLTATVNAGSSTNWYTASTGGLPVSTSTTYTTPSLSANTTYYVTAGQGTSVANVGLANNVGTTQNTGYSDVGLMFDAYSAFTIQSVNIYPVGSGAATVTISLKASDGTTLASTTANVTATAAPGIKTLVPLNFAVPSAGTNYRLTVTAATGLTGLTRESSTGYTYPYTLAGVCSITSAYTSGASSSYYYYLYDWLVTTGCETSRTPVNVTVNTAPTLTSSPTQIICNNTSGTLAVTSTLSNYDNYVWSPTTNLYTDAGLTTPYTGGNVTSGTVYVGSSTYNTTTYTVSATNNSTGCVNTSSSVVNVGLNANATATQINSCGGTGFINMNVSGAGTVVNNDFSSSVLPSNMTSAGNDFAITGGMMRFTSSAGSKNGGVLITNPTGVANNDFQIDFDMITTAGSSLPADGFSYSYGPDVVALPTGLGSSTVDALLTDPAASNPENGSGSALKLSFDAYTNGTNAAGVYLMYNCLRWNQASTTTQANGLIQYINNTSWRATATTGYTTHVTITIGSTGLVNLYLNGVQVVTNQQLPASYLSANKGTWKHAFCARTGGAWQGHFIDNLQIKYNNYYGYSIDGGVNWTTTSPIAVNPGTYNVLTRYESLTSCNVNSGSVTINPVSFTATSSRSYTCYGVSGSIDLNVTPNSFSGASYQWQNSPQGTNTWSNISGATSSSYTTSQTTSMDYRCVITCSGTTYYSNTLSISAVNPTLVSTNGDSRCGPGTVNLNATTSTPGASINWYTSSTGGLPISTNSTYSPYITSTTNYYATAQYGNNTYNVGKNDYAYYSNSTGASSTYGITFDATSAFNLQSVVVYPNNTTANTSGTLTIALLNSSGTELQSATVNVVANPQSATTNTPQRVNLNFSVPTGTGYRLVLKSLGTGVSSLGYQYLSTGFSYPYTVSGVCALQNSLLSGTTYTTYYYYFYDWLISTGCESARTLVSATINSAPPITVTSDKNDICTGETVTNSVTSTPSNYGYVYTWTPGSSLSGSSINVSPSATTKYYVDAVNSTTACTNRDSITIRIQPTPTITVASGSPSVCFNGTLNLSATPSTGYAANTLQWQSSTNGNTYTNISGATASSLTTPSISTTTYYRLLVKSANTSTICSQPTYTGIVYTPSVVSTVPGLGCAQPAAITVSASPSTGATIKWYDASTNGTLLSTNNSYTSPALSSSTTYYAAATQGSTNYSVGKNDYVYYSNATGASSTYGITFDAIQAFTLQSVVVYPNNTTANTSGSLTIALLNSSGTELQNATVNVVANPQSATTNTPQRVNLNFTVPSGTGYRLVLKSIGTGVTSLGYQYLSTGFSYPYTVSGVCTMQNSLLAGTAYTTYYYYFYDWLITTACESARTPVTATVSSQTIAPIVGPSVGCYKAPTTFTNATSLSSGLTGTWSVDPTKGTISNSGVLTTSVGTGSVTVNYTVSGSACSPSTVSKTITFPTTPTWNGTFGSSTSDASNWCNYAVPTSGSNIIVPSTYSTAPIMNNAMTVNNLTLASGATWGLGTGTLTLNGTLSSTGNLVGSSTGSLVINSTSTPVLNFTTNNSLNSLTLNNSATLGSDLNITGLLSVNNGSNLNINGKTFTLKSTSLVNSAVVGPFDGSFSGGNVIVERFIPQGTRAYRDLAPQVYNAGSIWSNWQESGTSSNYGIYITGKVGTSGGNDPVSGLDFTANGSPSMWTYTSSAGWNSITNTKTTNLNGFQGYRVFVRGNRAFNISQVGTTMPSSATLRVSGQLITGDVTFNEGSVTNTATGGTSSYGLSSGANNYSLIANPYVCPVDFGAVTTSGMNSNTYWILDPTFTNAGYNTYVSYNTIAGVNNNPSKSNMNQYIQPGQAIWVQNDGTSNSSRYFRFTENSKAPSQIGRAVFGNNTTHSLLAVTLHTQASGNRTNVDGAVAVFNNNFGSNIGLEDSKKLMNGGANVYINSNNTDLSIEGRPMPSVQDVIELRLSQLTANTTYELQVDGSQFNGQGVQAYILDRSNNSETAIGTSTGVISFNSGAQGNTANTSRFAIVFKPSTTLSTRYVQVQAVKTTRGNVVSWQTAEEKDMTSYVVERSVNGKDFTAITKSTVQAQGQATNNYSYTDAEATTANTYYRIVGVEKAGTKVISKVVMVQGEEQVSSIRVNPNPVQGRSFTVQTNQVKGGEYTLAMYSKSGQLVYSSKVQISGSNAVSTVQVTMDKALSAGTYSLKLIGTNLTTEVLVK